MQTMTPERLSLIDALLSEATGLTIPELHALRTKWQDEGRSSKALVAHLQQLAAQNGHILVCPKSNGTPPSLS